MPEAFKPLAPGRAQRYPGKRSPIDTHPGSARCDPFGIGLHIARYPVVFASLKPPANSFNPSRDRFTCATSKCVSEGSLGPAKSLAYALTHSGYDFFKTKNREVISCQTLSLTVSKFGSVAFA